MLAYYGDRIRPHMTDTPEGYLICHDVPIARCGTQKYLARELALDGDPQRIVEVQRHPEDVFEDAAVASFEGKPVTEPHPPEDVDPENWARYAKGHVQHVRRVGDKLVADLYINNAKLAQEIRDGHKREVSCGYLCRYLPEGTGYRQIQIRGNHVAVVPKGRAGSEVAIHDAAQKAEKGNVMHEFWKSVLTAFGMAAKDASPEQLSELVDTAASAMDAAPEKAPEKAQSAPEAAAPAAQKADAPTAQKDEAPDAGLGAKLDRILALLEAAKAAPAEKQEKDPLDAAIQQLEGKQDTGSAITVPAKQTDGCTAPGARDAALDILRRVRPAIAAIGNEQERQRVSDALLGAIRGTDQLPAVMAAAQDAAKANAAAASKNTYEQVCAEAAKEYAARNPHTRNKEV